ncbi:hypothetical protein [Rubellimicrobium sp. CFH 75288]|uniref:hypothetical protein n=1 Tax=Rubellimicrobium sp. CFH 75288 TaxID=2697034 RepID=UPI001412CF1D|nr:hypothetical protein [Rubellimicrobium sp. CFH 75288]NAZ35975.1 hypothetical protein [Rubellimicrobium sp. CFH 75288]
MSDDSLSDGVLPLRPVARPQAGDERLAQAPARRPQARSDGPPALPAEVGENATQSGAVDLGRTVLLGLFDGPDGPSALLRLIDGEVVRVERGAEVRGSRVSAIGNGSLRLQRNGVEVVLTLPG